MGSRRSGFADKGRPALVITVLLVTGFGLTSIFGFMAARAALRASVAGFELPAASDIVYERIQKDLVRPLYVSSMMANDSFLHDWAAQGERDTEAVIRYLSSIKRSYDAFTAFFVSERSRTYYHAGGILKTVSPSEPRDAWYFRVRQMREDYELNLDPDMANRDAPTVFINYRVVDRTGAYLGAAGIGLALESLSGTIARYKADYGVWVYIVDQSGAIIAGSPSGLENAPPKSLFDDPGLSALAGDALAGERRDFTYMRNRVGILLAVREVAELKWSLFVEKPETALAAGVRDTLWFNLGICLLILLAVLLAMNFTINRFQDRLRHTASVDALTGIMNRHAFDFVVENALKRSRRNGSAFSIIILDVDDFKAVNDAEGHLMGDAVLLSVARAAAASVRGSDVLCRWGGEEFIVALPECTLADALGVARKILSSASARRDGIPMVTLSAGAAELKGEESFDGLVRRADAALYESKRSGKNRVTAAE